MNRFASAMARSDGQARSGSRRPVRQAVGVGDAGGEANEITLPQKMFAIVVDEGHFTGKYVDKLVLLLMPVITRWFEARLQGDVVHPKLVDADALAKPDFPEALVKVGVPLRWRILWSLIEVGELRLNLRIVCHSKSPPGPAWG
jgi:hypothetical protein